MSSLMYRTIPEKPMTGGGGRGPLPPEPRGGGGGGGRGDGDDTPNHLDRLRRYRIGLYFAIGSIVMLFVSFTTLFFARRSAGRFDVYTGAFVTDWVSVPLPMNLLLFNTFILLLSSVTAELARRAAALEVILIPATRIPGVAPIPEHSRSWMRVTVMLGTAFLAGQWIAWQRVHDAVTTASRAVSSSFVYILTGAHAVHLFGGLLAASYTAFAFSTRRSLESRRIAIDVTASYWHFMGAMWVYVLIVLWVLH